MNLTTLRLLVFCGLAPTLFVFLPQYVIAQSIDGNANERSLLPEYCAYTNTTGMYLRGTGIVSEGAKKWFAINGESNQKHIHHYCWAMLRLLRSHSAQASNQVKKNLRDSALADIDYSIENSTADFPLLAELLTRKGTTLTLLNRRREAFAAFKDAIKTKPTHAAAYYELAHLQWREGDSASAQATIASGLTELPNSEMLKKLQLEIGQKTSGK
jgi:tetratricopeptide (TPR) repeat protein